MGCVIRHQGAQALSQQIGAGLVGPQHRHGIALLAGLAKGSALAGPVQGLADAKGLGHINTVFVPDVERRVIERLGRVAVVCQPLFLPGGNGTTGGQLVDLLADPGRPIGGTAGQRRLLYTQQDKQRAGAHCGGNSHGEAPDFLDTKRRHAGAEQARRRSTQCEKIRRLSVGGKGYPRGHPAGPGAGLSVGGPAQAGGPGHNRCRS